MKENKIIGTTINFKTFEVTQNKFPEKMSWNNAKVACEELGEGWRLPTKKELNILYENKEKIHNIEYSHFWSSSDNDGWFKLDGGMGKLVRWTQQFWNGDQFPQPTFAEYNVIAVRSL